MVQVTDGDGRTDVSTNKMNPLFHRRTKHTPVKVNKPPKLLSEPTHSITEPEPEPEPEPIQPALDPSWNFTPIKRTALLTKQDLLASVSLSAEEDRARKEGTEVLEDFEDDTVPINFRDDPEQVTNSNSNDLFTTVKKTQITPGLWKQLRATIFGTKVQVDGWDGQGFEWNDFVPFGFVQRKGGPCGVLAAVQALVLRDLIRTTTISNTAEIKSYRMQALSSVLTEIIWRCRTRDDDTAHICFRNAIGADIYHFDKMAELGAFVLRNTARFDCLNIIYSVVLSHGVESTHLDMDFPSPLITHYGYCTQELVNLFITGKANSNAFDGELELGEKVLRGISRKVDVGLLSLSEASGDCEVGSNLKNPIHPIWLICSESHYSVLFSTTELTDRAPFDLFYYDQLAGQESVIRLTMKPGTAPHSDSPLDKCIRTKWKDVIVDWNDTEPIL